MKIFYSLVFILFFPLFILAQSVTITGPSSCFISVVIPQADIFMGKPRYFVNAGNFAGISTSLIVSWSGSAWQILLGGATPAYTHSSDTPTPPNSGWTQVFGSGSCPLGSDPLTMTGGTPLPVELIYFKANFEDKVSTLTWGTATELNNMGVSNRTEYKWTRLEGAGFSSRKGDDGNNTGLFFY